jgi:hypothetical protein
MAMSDDWKRLEELEQSGGQQYGTTLRITPRPGDANLVQVSLDLIRFQGQKVDINAWRLYLGPWQPSPKIQLDTGGIIFLAADGSTVNYAQPTPWAPPQPRNFDAMTSIDAYARIMWGAGGVQHTAFVDWPRRGMLLQVSGSTVQVNALVDTKSQNATADQLPLLSASLGPEPGGGDAVQPATFTYSPSEGEFLAGPPRTFARNFQIPPFARAFVPVVNLSKLIADSAVVNVSVQTLPGSLELDNEQQTWMTPVGGAYDPAFGMDPFPICGQQSGNVRIVITTEGSSPRFGCMFLLDL